MPAVLSDNVKVLRRQDFSLVSSCRFRSQKEASTEFSNSKLVNVCEDVDVGVGVEGCPSRNIGPRPIIPFHIRLENYRNVRKKIFNEEPRISRSTKRIQQFWKKVKKFKKDFAISVLGRPGDVRPYAEVVLLGKNVIGLLDTGASVSCLGSQAALEFLSSNIPYKKLHTTVNTADGKPQHISGVFTTDIVFRGKSLPLTIYVVPNLSQNLILGIDF